MNRLRKQAQSNMAEHTEATPKNYLINDGGATKTIAVITDQDGKILGKARAAHPIIKMSANRLRFKY